MADTILTFADYADEATDFLALPRLPRTPIHTHRRANSYAEYLAEWHQRFQGQALPPKPGGELPSAEAFVNCGRWVWQCLCGSALAVEPGEDLICVRCGMGGWRTVVWPGFKEEIETQLLSLPGHRQNAPLRQWKTVWSVDDLRTRVAKADALIGEGIEFPRTLSIGGTRVWVTGEILTAANMNQYISQVMEDLAGRNGLIEFEDSISFPDSATNPFRLPRGTTGQRPGSPLEAMFRYNTTLNQAEFYDGTNWTPLPTDAATFAGLQALGLIGTGAGQLAVGNHTHTPTTTLIGSDVSTSFSASVSAAQNVWGPWVVGSGAPLSIDIPAADLAAGDHISGVFGGQYTGSAASIVDVQWRIRETTTDTILGTGDVTATQNLIQVFAGDMSVSSVADLNFVFEMRGRRSVSTPTISFGRATLAILRYRL